MFLKEELMKVKKTVSGHETNHLLICTDPICVEKCLNRNSNRSYKIDKEAPKLDDLSAKESKS